MIYMLWNHTEKKTDEEKTLKRDMCVLGGGGGFFWGGGLHFCLLVLRHLCLILAACSPQGQYKKWLTVFQVKKRKSHFNFIQFCDY